jgi:hypothetical protein
MDPEVAPAGTEVVMEVSPLTVNRRAEVPLNLTEVAPTKATPVILTEAPTWPEVGWKELTTGTGALTVKAPGLVPLPAGVTTETGPVLAPTGTMAVMEVSPETAKTLAGVSLNLTEVAPVNPVPVRVTDAPTNPTVG